jgi:hypothetical protein
MRAVRSPDAILHGKTRNQDCAQVHRLVEVPQLDLDYRKSPICGEHRPRSAPPRFADGPHGGAPARAAGPLEVGGRTVTLFDLLRGPRHSRRLFVGGASARRRDDRLATLADSVVRGYAGVIDVYLVHPADVTAAPDTPRGVTIVRDPEQALQRRYGAGSGCAYLIRPDGYVGYRGASVTLPRFRQYLDRVFASVRSGCGRGADARRRQRTCLNFQRRGVRSRPRRVRSSGASPRRRCR